MSKINKRDIVEILANYYMEEYEVEDWSFVISNRLTKSYAQVTWDDKLLEISSRHIESDTLESIIDSIKHEISHILCGEVKHGFCWKYRLNELKNGEK